MTGMPTSPESNPSNRSPLALPAPPPPLALLAPPPTSPSISTAPPLSPVEPHEPEDLEREPDGMPHAVIGLTVLLSVGLAMVAGAFFLLDSPARIWVVLLALIAIAVTIVKLTLVADRDRDHVHPSR